MFTVWPFDSIISTAFLDVAQGAFSICWWPQPYWCITLVHMLATGNGGMGALARECEGVEELHYEAVDMSSRPSIFDEDENGDGPPPCPALRRLCLAGFDANPHTLLSLADACPNLTDLAVLGGMVRVPQDEWTTFVQSGRLPDLQRLVVPAGQNKPPFTFWEPHQRDELRDACRSRGVSLAVGALSKGPDLD